MSNTKSLVFPTFFLTAFLLLSFAFAPVSGDPVAILDHPEVEAHGELTLSPEKFTQAKGVRLLLDGDKQFAVAEFEMVKVPAAADPVSIRVRQPAFNGSARKLVDSAKSGDTYYFERILAREAGADAGAEAQKLNSFVVRIE